MPTDPQANILLIQVDQMHAEAMSCLGSVNVKTPNLDRLAGQGVVFRHAVANNAICMPSRISMLSGQYCSTNGQFGFSGYCRPDMPWLPRTFKQAGYRTGAFGKFHILCVGNKQWSMDVAHPTSPEDNDLSRPPGENYTNYCREHGVPWPTDQMHCHNPYGENGKPPSTATEDMNWARQRSCKSEAPLEHGLEKYTTGCCLDFIRQCAADDKPFFAWLTYDRPHSPTTLPEPWFSQVDPGAIELPCLPPAETIMSLPPSYFWSLLDYAGIGAMGEEQFRFTLATYFKCIEHLDDEIGQVMKLLAETALDGNTTIVFTADHGDEAGSAGLYDKLRGVDSDGVTRVPLIIRPAPTLGVMGGRMLSEPVELVDLAPTLCRLHGLETEAAMEGRDLGPCLTAGAPLDAKRSVFCEDYFTRMVEHDSWRLSYNCVDVEENQLYDRHTDPFCFNNRYRDPTCRRQRLDLKRRLFAFLMARMHGPYTEADVEYIERGLDPDDSLLPALNCGGPANIQFLRAAAYCTAEEHCLLVPFYEAEMLLFKGTGNYYQSRADALAFDESLAESILDRALEESFRAQHSVALWINEKAYHWMRPGRKPDAAEVEKALAAWRR